ncbi:hypothetical protein MRX96_058366 [Rhipicephalus microplus]
MVCRRKIFLIVDDLGVILLGGDAELYATADGRTLRVVCASGQLATTGSTNGRDTPTTLQDQAMPTTQAATTAAASFVRVLITVLHVATTLMKCCVAEER